MTLGPFEAAKGPFTHVIKNVRHRSFIKVSKSFCLFVAMHEFFNEILLSQNVFLKINYFKLLP